MDEELVYGVVTRLSAAPGKVLAVVQVLDTPRNVAWLNKWRGKPTDLVDGVNMVAIRPATEEEADAAIGQLHFSYKINQDQEEHGE